MKICVIGPSKKFLSGITYFTIDLANALNKKYDVSVLHLRTLIPAFLFPGAKRVGNKNLTNISLNKSINVYDGIDWYWIPSMFKAIRFLKKENPDVIIFQWWTGSVAHSYLLLKILNKLFFKKKIIIEFHEVQDVAEAKIPLVKPYMKFMSKLLFKNFDAYVCHSKSDAKLLKKAYNVKKISIVPHGSHDKKKLNVKKEKDVCNILFFGLIRQYKGLQYLIDAFDKIPENQIDKYKLLIVGEAWEDTNPEEMVAKSKYKDKINLVNRYVSDDEISKFFSMADVVVLPYLRASQSGAAHIATGYGIPVIVSEVGGLKESMKDYKGTTFVKPKDSAGIRDAILKTYSTMGKRYENPHSWEKTTEKFEEIFKEIMKK